MSKKLKTVKDTKVEHYPSDKGVGWCPEVVKVESAENDLKDGDITILFRPACDFEPGPKTFGSYIEATEPDTLKRLLWWVLLYGNADNNADSVISRKFQF